jgi:hypothetical protein
LSKPVPGHVRVCITDLRRRVAMLPLALPVRGEPFAQCSSTDSTDHMHAGRMNSMRMGGLLHKCRISALATRGAAGPSRTGEPALV